MALGELTRQLAQQALGNQMKEVLDPKPAAPAQPESIGVTIVGQVQAMQTALKDDQELVVLVNTGPEMIRVQEFFVPSWRVVVLTGVDANKNITRIISPIESTQLVCKVVKTSTKPLRVAFITPKSKLD